MRFLAFIFCCFLPNVFAQSVCEQRISVEEELPVGTEVADLDPLFGSCALSHGLSRSTKFQMLESNRYLELRENRSLVMRSRLDREAVCDQEKHCCSVLDCQFKIIFMPVIPSSQNAYFHLDVDISDINDNKPTWIMPLPLYIDQIPLKTISILELSAVGTKIPIPQAIDADAAPENQTAFYRLTEPCNTFSLETDPSLHLLLRERLNYDQQKNYLLTVEASDSGLPEPQRGYLKLNISVQDQNNHAPKLEEVSAHVKVFENNMNVSPILYKIRASDLDSVDQLHYGWAGSASAEIKSLFSLDPRNGEIRLNGMLDYEKRSEYRLPVEVTDGQFTAQGEILVTVINVNDNLPVLKLTALDTVEAVPKELNTAELITGAKMTLKVMENSEPGKWIATLSYEDPDDAELALQPIPKCQLSNDALQIQPLDLPSSSKKRLFKVLTGKEPFDREARSRYNVIIECLDSGVGQAMRQWHPQRPPAAVLSVEIVVLDQNDNPPKFIPSILRVNLTENANIDTLVTQLQ
ncbi:hypothetical protein Ciccas_009034, partial [Cichlidogyrus casuarinus]